MIKLAKANVDLINIRLQSKITTTATEYRLYKTGGAL